MSRHTGIVLSFIASFALSFQMAHAADVQSIDLGMERSQAIVSALDRFRTDGYKTDGYRMVITQQEDSIEVIFVPRLTSDDPLSAKPSGLPEVHYYLDSSGKKVLRRLFGK